MYNKIKIKPFEVIQKCVSIYLATPYLMSLFWISFNALLRTPYIFKGNIKIAGPGLYPGAPGLDKYRVLSEAGAQGWQRTGHPLFSDIEHFAILDIISRQYTFIR